ncbi:MAG: isochorismatase family protein [Mucilaginibacter sp.]|uniref:isochorismatase family protein n=1 Tax=Mucilaginibacter sp. TaxID=1882438 RepID=UPI0026109C47|nr:isochorismatase family protein [Mucilaginibacter sp.]MDB5003122.1 isochorismatase family protein [Mucilaginibacter sp.]
MITALDKRTALVLIDLQKGVVTYPVAHPIETILMHAAKLVAAFRKAGQPIVIVNVNPAGPWTKSRKEPASPRPAPPADWADIAPEIKTEPTDIFITKHTWGAFFETALDDELKKRNVTGIVIGGVSTSRGVEGTARQASELGYNITFATDAMTDMVADAHANSIKYIFPGIGEVGVTDSVIEQLAVAG